MAKNRRKKRRKRQGGQAAAPPPPVLRPSRVAPEERPDVVAARPSGPGTEGTVVGTVVEVEREFIWLDVGGERAVLYASELMLGVGERPADRHAVGDRFEAVVFQMGSDPESSAPQFSVRRASPYPEALAGLELGAEVQATVVNTYDAGIELEIDGVRGNAYSNELPLQPGESPHQRYKPGETIESVLVGRADREVRHLALSVKRSTPEYVAALQRHAVGDVVAGTVTTVDDDGSLWLDVDGLVGSVEADELARADGESARERYVGGKTMEGLLVQAVNHDGRYLRLSVKRNAPEYVAALQQRTVGDVVSATITGFQSNDGLWLDVGGLVGGVAPDELVLADGESVRDRYAVDETINGLFVQAVDYEDRELRLSVKRNTPRYVNALQQRVVGEVVSATVTDFWGNGRGLWLDVDGLVGSVPLWELDLASGESARERYNVGETIDGLFVWQVNQEDRDLDLSAKRNAPGYVEALKEIARGDEIDGVVVEANRWGVWLGAAGVVGSISASELLLNDRESPSTRYTAGDKITAHVWQIDHEARDIILSVRRLATDFSEGLIVPGAEINVTVRGTTPHGVRRPVRVLAADSSVSIPPHALSLSTGMSRSFRDGEEIRAVVVELGDAGRPTRLSHRRALGGWKAEVGRLSPGTLVQNARVVPTDALSEAELRMGSAAADLGPILGFISGAELDHDSGLELMNYNGNELYRVVIESVDRERGTAIVSHDRFEERWRELAADFEAGAEVKGELREVEGRVALLDLGAGLLAEMPVEQLPARAEGDEAEQDWIGETVTVQVKSIEAETYTIAAEIKNYELVQMIAGNESATCEFKAVFQGQREGDSKEVRSGYPVVRAMAGMMNQAGGHVLVGVYEDQETKKGVVIGWEESGFDTEDGFVNELSKVVGEMLTTEAGGLYGVRFETLPGGERIADIDCRRAERPIFTKKAWMRGARADFFVRYEGATRRPADDRELHEYIQGRFYGREA